MQMRLVTLTVWQECVHERDYDVDICSVWSALAGSHTMAVSRTHESNALYGAARFVARIPAIVRFLRKRALSSHGRLQQTYFHGAACATGRVELPWLRRLRPSSCSTL